MSLCQKCSRYFKAGSEPTDLIHTRELFSFGSGSWYDGRDAVEILEADGGNVIPCTLSMESLVIVDKKKAPAHIHGSPCLDKALPLREVLLSLQDKGEAPQVGKTSELMMLIPVTYHPLNLVDIFQICLIELSMSKDSLPSQ